LRPAVEHLERARMGANMRHLRFGASSVEF
jgi:hypothetical protein